MLFFFLYWWQDTTGLRAKKKLPLSDSFFFNERKVLLYNDLIGEFLVTDTDCVEIHTTVES